MESRYSVRQTADMTGVKPYVLRYWEEELGISIQRNEMGHRYYTGHDIQLFLNIKELKKKGLQLRAVKNLLPEMVEKIWNEKEEPFPKRNMGEEKNPSEKMVNEKFKDIKTALILEEKCEKSVKDSEEDEIKILEFQSILERLILRELSARDEEEEKCRSLDMAIRRQQLMRKEVAAAGEKKSGRRMKHT